MEALAARFGVSFEQACHRLSTLQRTGRARRAVLLRAGRSGGQCIEALLRRRVSVRALWRIVSALGGAHGVRPARRGAGAGRRVARRRRLSVLRAHRDAARARPGANRGRCMSWRWAARWRMPTTVVYADGLDLERREGRHRPVVPAVRPARIAAAAHFRRWSTGCRSTRRWPARRRIGSRREASRLPAPLFLRAKLSGRPDRVQAMRLSVSHTIRSSTARIRAGWSMAENR